MTDVPNVQKDEAANENVGDDGDVSSVAVTSPSCHCGGDGSTNRATASQRLSLREDLGFARLSILTRASLSPLLTDRTVMPATGTVFGDQQLLNGWTVYCLYASEVDLNNKEVSEWIHTPAINRTYVTMN